MGSVSQSNDMLPRPCPVALAHAVMRTTTTNYRKMIEFYQELVNGEIIMEEKTFAFLRYDHEHHRIGIMMMPDCQPKPTGDYAGLEHISFAFGSLTEMARVYQHMKSLGYEPYYCVNHGMTTSMYYRDPERNKCEIQIENFDTPEEADAFVRGPLFTANPIGTDFEAGPWAEAILGKMKSNGEPGLTEEEDRAIKKREEIGERHQAPWIAICP